MIFPASSFSLPLLAARQILLLIGLSCVTIAIDEPGRGGGGPTGALKDVLVVMDLIFTISFAAEVALKMVAFGVVLHPGSYLRNRWNVLDVVISTGSVTSLFIASTGVNLASLKALRSLRALRPLRMVRRMPGLKIVIDSLFKALPPCFHVAMILVLFFLVFAILGFNFFKGTLGSCNDCTRGCAAGMECALPCEGFYNASSSAERPTLTPRVWANPDFGNAVVPGSDISFDNVLNSMVLFFEVATLEMWLEIMYASVDGTSPGYSPRRDSKPEMVFVFIIFIVLLNFFMLNVFVSVVIDNFNRIKSAGENIFVTPEQRAWIEMQRNLDLISEIEGSGGKAMQVQHGAAWPVRMAFHIVVGRRFEGMIMGLILTNILVMCCSYEGESAAYTATLEGLNLAFFSAFWLECVLKLLAFGPREYAACKWNRFDFLVIALDTTVLLVEVSLGSSSFGVDLTLLRVVRIARVFRLLKKMPGLKALFRTLYYSLPSLFNVGAIMFMLVYVYAAVGMNLFGGICYSPTGGARGDGDYVCENVNGDANFDTMATALLTLFRMLTGESWNAIAHDCAGETSGMALLYFMSFVVFGQFIMLNLFVAVVVENFQDLAGRADEHVVAPEDLHRYKKLWEELWEKMQDDRTYFARQVWMTTGSSAHKLSSVAVEKLRYLAAQEWEGEEALELGVEGEGEGAGAVELERQGSGMEVRRNGGYLQPQRGATPVPGENRAGANSGEMPGLVPAAKQTAPESTAGGTSKKAVRRLGGQGFTQTFTSGLIGADGAPLTNATRAKLVEDHALWNDPTYLPCESVRDLLVMLPPPLGLRGHHYSRPAMMSVLRVMHIPCSATGCVEWIAFIVDCSRLGLFI